MKKSNNLSNVEKIKKYAKSMGIQVGNSGLNFDLGLDFKKKYTDQGMIFNKNDDSDKSETEKKSSEIKEKSKNKEKTTAELQSKTNHKKINNKNCKEHESINCELLSNQECLKNAIILKEILDNQRIQRRRKRYSRFRSGRI